MEDKKTRNVKTDVARRAAPSVDPSRTPVARPERRPPPPDRTAPRDARRRDPRQGDPRQGAPRQGDPRQGAPRQGDPRQGAPRQGDPRRGAQGNRPAEGSRRPQGAPHKAPEREEGRKPHDNGFASLINKIKSRMTPKIAMFTAIGTVAAVFLICMLINIIIGVRTVEVIGNDLASDEEIISIAGIETGSGYFSYNTGRAERAVLENIHCISDINVSRSLFGRVTVTVTEKKACWYTEVYGVYYALTRELEVIRKLDIRDDYVNRGLVRLDFPSVDEAVLGKTLKYSDGDRDCSFVPAFLDEILNSELYKEGRLDQVKMETKFEIFAVCDMKYKINLGKYSGAAMKLSSVRLVIEQIDDDLPHEIEASDVGNIAERENRELDFSYLEPMLGG